MAQRVVIGLKPGADATAVKNQVVAAGAESVSDPSSSQPGVLVASIPAERGIEHFIEQVKQIQGVRYAEPDAMRFTL